mmetsp:Transcript_7465/g.10595  ORF Transcript_7465/g.10595 Transcript_7465/m.10595 type:complete len:396 (+) Transcript_7465:119-1306(+)
MNASSSVQTMEDLKSNASEFMSASSKLTCKRIRQQQQQRHNHQEESVSSTSMYNSIAAGYIAGVCGIIIGHPLDSIKVMLQTQSAQMVSPITLRPTLVARAGSATVHTAAMPYNFLQQRQHMTATTQATATRTTSSTTAQHSLKRLYAGAKGPLLTAGIIQSINFCIYDSLRRILHHYDDSEHTNNAYLPSLHKDSLYNIALASTFSGAATTILTSPLIIIKTKQQLTGWNFQRALRETARSSSSFNNGGSINLKNFYVGFGPHLFACSVGRGVYMCAYEMIKQQIAERKVQQATGVTMQERMICAALAGMTCWSVIFPMDALQNQMYKQALTSSSSSTNGNKTMSTYEMATMMYRQNGIGAFYRGFGVTILRAGPVAAAVLPVFDMSLEWLSQD